MTHNQPNPEHIISRGEWGPGTTWELALSQAKPDASLCAAVACVAIGDIDTREIVLTLNTHSSHPARQGKWELLAGHVDLLDPKDPDGPRETIEQALAREALEESGFIVERAEQYGYRKIINAQPSDYPEFAYMPYYWATTSQPLVEPTDPGQPAQRSFPIETVRGFVESGHMQAAELEVIEHGLAAAIRTLRP